MCPQQLPVPAKRPTRLDRRPPQGRLLCRREIRVSASTGPACGHDDFQMASFFGDAASSLSGKCSGARAAFDAGGLRLLRVGQRVLGAKNFKELARK